MFRIPKRSTLNFDLFCEKGRMAVFEGEWFLERTSTQPFEILDKEFTDVTFACNDGQQVEAHKVSTKKTSSPFSFWLKISSWKGLK